MHTFPRHVKEKAGVVVQSPSPTQASQYSDDTKAGRASVGPRTSEVRGQGSQQHWPAPHEYDGRQRKPGYLVTIDRHNPMRRRYHRLGMQNESDGKPVEPRKHDEVRDLVMGCDVSMPASFINALENDNGLLMLNKQGVMLMIERMRQHNVAMDVATYNLLLEKVADLKDDLVFQIYEDLKSEWHSGDSPVEPDLHTFHLMMRACDRQSNYKKAFHIYSQMKEVFSKKPDLAMYNMLIGFCAPLHDETTASYLIEEMRHDGVDPDVHTYNSLMAVFIDAPYELILQTFQDMVKRKVRPNRRTYNTLMKACSKTGDYDNAFMFFEEMKKEGIAPDVVTYNILLVMCRERLDYVFGTGQFAALRRTKDQVAMGMKAVAELAMALMAEMEDLRILPNTFTYNALLGVLSRCNDLRVYEVFDPQMKNDRRGHTASSEGESSHVVLPSHPTESTAWVAETAASQKAASGGQGLGRAAGVVATADDRKAPGVGEKYTDATASSIASPRHVGDGLEDPGEARIGGFGVRPNLETYTILIEASQRLQLPDRAFALLDEMKAEGIKANKQVFIKLLSVCTVKSERAKAYQIVEEAKREGIVIDTDMYNALMNVLAAAGDSQIFSEFENLKRAQEGTAVKPNIDSYNIVLKACCKLKKPEAALAIYTEMCSPHAPIGPDAMSYALMLDNCAIDKDIALATDLILQMKQRGVPPTITTYCRLMNVFVAAEDPGVVEVFRDIQKHGPAPNLEAYTILLSYYLQTRSPAITQLFEEMKSSGVEPDLNAFNIMLDYCALTPNNQTKSFKYFEQIKERGLNPDIETYNALLKVFASVHTPRPEDSTVFRIFEEMAECRIPADSVTFSILLKHEDGRRYLAAAQEARKIYVEPALLIKQ